MTISMWLMIAALAVGTGSSLSAESDPTPTPDATRPGGKIASNCWINGVWYNPCPPDPSPPPPPAPDILLQL